MNINKAMFDEDSLLTIEKNIFDPNSQQITVFPSLPIISKRNDKKLDVVNNEQFTVEDITEDETIIIKNEEREIEITNEQFQKTFYPAYCITIHSAQGATFNFPYTIHEWSRLSTKLKYVALTRATRMDHVNII